MVHLEIGEIYLLPPLNRSARLMIFSGLSSATFLNTHSRMAGKRPYDVSSAYETSIYQVSDKAFFQQSPERELSPESEKFGSIIMPKGSFRRPAITKYVPRQTTLYMTNQIRPFNQLACILHIEKLNPSLDDAPLHSITREWLDTAEEELPEDSNKRILRFMHEHEAYGLKDNKPRFDKLVKELIIGTEIQALEDYDLVVFEPRVMDRLRSLSRNLSERSFINHIDGKLIKTEEFLKCWESRDTYWKANAPVIESVDRSAEADEGFNEDVVPERPMTPPRKAKRSLFTPKALASGKVCTCVFHLRTWKTDRRIVAREYRCRLHPCQFFSEETHPSR